MLICKDFKFEAAHHLNNYEGQCANLHGHSYFGKVWIRGEIQDPGFVIDFNEIKEIINLFDHQNLNDLQAFENLNPTAENIANVILQMLEQKLTRYSEDGTAIYSIAVKLHETATSYVFTTNTHDQYFISTLSI